MYRRLDRATPKRKYFAILFSFFLTPAGQVRYYGLTMKKRYKGVQIRATTRMAIYLRDGFTCTYCQVDLSASPQERTLDHIVPASKGGSNKPSNLVLSCRACNCSRQDTPLRRFADDEGVKRANRRRQRSMRKFRALVKEAA